MSRTSTSGGYTVKTVGEAWDIVHAAATDHTNRIMRKAGRSHWNEQDSEAHTEHLYKLLAGWGFWDGDKPTDLYFAMRADRHSPFIIAESRPTRPDQKQEAA